MNDLSINQSKENVVYQEPSPYESSSSNTNTSGQIHYHFRSGPRNNDETAQPFVNPQLPETQSCNAGLFRISCFAIYV